METFRMEASREDNWTAAQRQVGPDSLVVLVAHLKSEKGQKTFRMEATREDDWTAAEKFTDMVFFTEKCTDCLFFTSDMSTSYLRGRLVQTDN